MKKTILFLCFVLLKVTSGLCQNNQSVDLKYFQFVPANVLQQALESDEVETYFVQVDDLSYKVRSAELFENEMKF